MILAPLAKQRFYDNNNNPLNKGQLFCYVAGTTTKQTTYSDSAGTPNTNPVILNYRGECDLWLDTTKTYKFVLAPANDTDPPTNAFWSVDNIPGGYGGTINYTQLVYPQTPAELAASVAPTALYFPEFYARRYGAQIDGITSANAGIAAADSVATAAAFGAIIFSDDGQYLISSNLTITNDILFVDGCAAQIKVATGVTLRLLGGMISEPRQRFNLVGTGTVVFGNTTSNQKWAVAKMIVYPEYWGARGLQGPNAATTGDTVAVQACFDSHREFKFLQDYPVTQVILTGNEVTGDFGGFELRGIATIAKTSVLDLKCGYSSINRIQVSSEFNYRYECAIHWYTNDLNTYYPGQNRFYGMWARNALIGICIGALPSQADPIPAQGTVQAAGIATNAPLSESTIYGFKTVDTVISVYYRQPNGKITIQGDVLGSAANWTGLFGTSGYTAASTCALILGHEGNELSLIGGSLEQVNNSTGTYFQVGGGTLNLIGVTQETIVPAYIGNGTAGTASDARVNIVNANDFGFNFPATYQAFNIDDACVGQLSISNCFMSYPNGSLTSFQHPAFYGVHGLGGAFSPNLGKFQIKLSNIELNDVPFVQGTTGYAPLAQGVDLMINGATLASYTAAVRTSSQYLSDDTSNLLAGQVDTSAYIITAYGLNGNAASGGWTFAVSNAGTCNWGSTASGITYFGKTLDKSLRLTAPAGETTTATSPKFSCQAEKTYLLRGFIKTGATASNMKIRALWWKFDSTAASTASTDLYNAAESVFGATAQQLLLYLTPPKDAVKMSLFFDAENGATMYITDPNVT